MCECCVNVYFSSVFHAECHGKHLAVQESAEYICGLLQKKDKDYLGIEGDEESSMFEDSVSPAK